MQSEYGRSNASTASDLVLFNMMLHDDECQDALIRYEIAESRAESYLEGAREQRYCTGCEYTKPIVYPGGVQCQKRFRLYATVLLMRYGKL